MNNIFLLFFFLLALIFSSNAFAQDNSVIFYNNSDKLLNCGIKEGNDFIPFVRLDANKSKVFDLFLVGKEIRCSTEIEKQRSSTMLTYFEVKEIGTYEFLQDYVSCPGCKNTDKLRKATIVVFPNGKPYYTKFRGSDFL